MKFRQSNNISTSEQGSALPTNDKDIAMKLTLLALFLLFITTAQAQIPSPSGPARQFHMLQQSVACIRKSDEDYLECRNKNQASNVETGSNPALGKKPDWIFEDRKVKSITGLIDFPGCENPTKNYIGFSMDVDRDGDQDLLYGFECFDPLAIKTVEEAEQNSHLKFDDSLQWVADSYLAVMINDNGEFHNDQSIFGGEYPVIDNLMKTQTANIPRDHNGDGYPDVVLIHHWDNAKHRYLNEKNLGLPVAGAVFASGSTVILSDGQGGYRVHIMPISSDGQVANFYTDEQGDTYVWAFGNNNFVTKDEQAAFAKNLLGIEWRPYVGKVSGGELRDVTDRYFTRIQAASNDWIDHCYVPSNKPLQGCGQIKLEVLADHKSQNIGGKVYQNIIAGNLQYKHYSAFWQTIPEMRECQSLYQINNAEALDAWRRCQIDYVTNHTIDLPALGVYAMNSKTGLYLKNAGTVETQYRVYIADFPQEKLEQDPHINPNLLLDEQIHVQPFLKLNDTWHMANGWGWGLDVVTQNGEQVAIVNIAGALLDPDVQPSDPEVDQYFNWLMENDPDDRWSWQGSVSYYTDHATGIYETIEAGYCPDLLDKVEPEDCVDEIWLTQNWVDRGTTMETEYGRSVGFLISTSSIAQISGLTNRNMGFNPQRTFLVDYDTDGDLDILLTTHNAECSSLCMYENLGEYNFEILNTGIWQKANDDYFEFMAEICRGPQHIDDGNYGDQNLCDLSSPQAGLLDFFNTLTGFTRMADIDGDNILDIFKISRLDGITVIYGK